MRVRGSAALRGRHGVGRPTVALRHRSAHLRKVVPQCAPATSGQLLRAAAWVSSSSAGGHRVARAGDADVVLGDQLLHAGAGRAQALVLRVQPAHYGRA